MATRTITAMFNSRAEADRAVQALTSQLGLGRGAVDIGSGSQPGEQEGFLSSLKSLFVPDEDRHAYAEGMRRGGAVVTAKVEEARIDQAMDVLEQHGAVDLDEREAEWKRSGWTGYAGGATTGAVAGTAAVVGMSSDGSSTGVAAMPGAATAPMAATATTATATTARTAAPAATSALQGEESIPIVEEQLTVGKRAVNRGRVRVRSYVVETPVQEQVSLRQEHVEVERRVVNRPVTGADQALFQERTIEATESSEEAVVAKEARVVEELVVRKDAEERVQTVQDTVRRTEVEIEDQRSAGGTATGPVTKTGTATAAPAGTSTTRPPGRDRR
jgi:uncharacterized protein (TIGR02271 family)